MAASQETWRRSLVLSQQHSVVLVETKVRYWLSCRGFTVQVNCDDDDKIIFAAPIVRKFRGQPLSNLFRWMNTFGGFQVERW